MMTRAGVAMSLVVVLCGVAIMSFGGVADPGSPPIIIVKPSDGLPPEVAALSGVWEGTWPGGLKCRLIVIEVRANMASIVHFWGKHPTGTVDAGWERVRAKVLPDGSLNWGQTPRYSFRLSSDRASLEGSRERAGTNVKIVLKKVTVPAPAPERSLEGSR